MLLRIWSASPPPNRRPWTLLPSRGPLLVLCVLALLLAAACTATPVPAASPVPSPSATLAPTVQTASSSLAERALGYVRKLAESPRDTRSGGERMAAQYIQEEFRGMGYSPELQPFSLTLYSRDAPRLMVLEPRQESVEAEPLAQSITGDVTGELAFAGLGRAEDFPADGLKWKVALMDRGVIRFSDKVDNAARQGAVAAVIVNNRPGPLFGALVGPGPIPVVGVSQEDGGALKRLAQQGGARVRVHVKEEEFASQNVIAEKPGSGQGVVIIGGHYDSVPGVAGAGDNASGMAAVLTIARETAGRQYPFTLRFMGFGAEELGLIGSSRYVESLSADERGRIRAVLNLDVVGGASNLTVGGDGQLGSRMRELASGLGLTVGTAPGDTGSDHLPFIRAGIPAVIITTPDYDVIHTPQDTVDRVSPEPLGKAVELVLAFLEAMAREAGGATSALEAYLPNGVPLPIPGT